MAYTFVTNWNLDSFSILFFMLYVISTSPYLTNFTATFSIYIMVISIENLIASAFKPE